MFENLISPKGKKHRLRHRVVSHLATAYDPQHIGTYWFWSKL